jgi:Mg-chelatase subunit ChlD
MSNMISPEVNIARDGLVTKNELNRDAGKSSPSMSTGSRSKSTGSRSTNSRGSSAGHQSRSSIDANNLSVRATPLSHSPGNPLPQEKSVRFNEIHIRDYERTVGDNPSCSSGPPIG